VSKGRTLTEELDSMVFAEIWGGATRASSLEFLADASNPSPSFRQIDRSLQRLRKRGKIRFMGPRRGWEVAQ